MSKTPQKSKNQTRSSTGGPRHTVGLVYNQNCIHCQHLDPEWQKMKKNIKGKLTTEGTKCEIKDFETSQPSYLVEIKKIHSNLLVNGVPTIFKVTSDGKLHYYAGQRTAEELTEWALQASQKQNLVGGFIYKKPLSIRNKLVKHTKKNTASKVKTNTKSRTLKSKTLRTL